MYRITLLFAVTIYACLGLAKGYRPSYRAAVYEHALFQPTHFRSVSRNQALRDMKKNLDIYAEQTRIASSENVDIIVFPEDGIYGLNFNRDTIKPYLEDIPDPKEFIWNPCNQSEYANGVEVQITLSCMARNNGIYVVANMGDKKVCDADSICPDDGQRQYNTDVVFDPQGNLVARYHKVCVLLKCEFTDITSCGQPTKTAAGHFEYLKLWGTFTTEYVFPEVLVSHDGKLRLEHEHWKYLHNRIEFVNRGKERPLLSATLYGRHYDRDNSTVANGV
ncbi:pantetheinase [Patella vulgata]|uniref:pantetheinase n=1 Tax=Patella vulgata TaxID=6465 RepID=UPI0021806CDC|nr:pantetheinase [Patella vulgata]